MMRKFVVSVFAAIAGCAYAAAEAQIIMEDPARQGRELAVQMDGTRSAHENAPELKFLQHMVHQLQSAANRDLYEIKFKALLKALANADDQEKGLNVLGVALAGERYPELIISFPDSIAYFLIQPSGVRVRPLPTLCDQDWLKPGVDDADDLIPADCKRWYRMQEELEAIKLDRPYSPTVRHQRR